MTTTKEDNDKWADASEWKKWADVRERMNDSIDQRKRKRYRKILADHFGGTDKIPNLRKAEVEKIVNKAVYTRSLLPNSLGGLVIALLFLMLFGFIIGVMAYISTFPGW